MFVLIVYDISDNSVRNDLANYLRCKGFTRIQRSCFIGRPPPSITRDVERYLPRFIKSPSDVIHVFPLHEISLKYIKVYGNPLAEISTTSTLMVIS